jgi:E3 ubiquitin-protein ligase DRIP
MPTAERGQRSQYSLYSNIPNQYTPPPLTFPLSREIETGTLDTSLKIELPESYCFLFHIVLFEDMDERRFVSLCLVPEKIWEKGKVFYFFSP